MKARVVKMTGHGMAAARHHLSYIERDGVERDGSEGRLYDAGETVDRASLSDAIPGERHQFRFIVSPEDDVDLTAFTRDFMRQVESDLGVRLRWGAVNHYNTDNPHVHVVVRGVDKDGHEVWIDRAYISERMRWQAQHLLTNELGPRPLHEIERQLEREVSQERLTSLDRRLALVAGAGDRIDVRGLATASRDVRQQRRLVGRLQTLETLQLAARASAETWHLAPGWQDALRELGERDGIIKRLHRAMGPSGNPTMYEVVDGRADHPPIEGVVRRKGLHDELGGAMSLAIETPRGESVYAHLHPAAAEAIAEGTVVRIAVDKQTWAKPMDRVIQKVSLENGGIYDPVAHLAQLRRAPVIVGGKAVAAEAVVEANVRRLARLERHRIVERLPDGCWRVPPDLVELLKARDASHPRRLVRAETVAPRLDGQVSLRAPCWLDRQDPAAPRAPYGLGAALATALDARTKFLAGLGITAASPEHRLRALERLERLDLARKLAAEHAVIALPEAIAGMRGRMVPCGTGADGAPLAYVIDQPSRRLAVMPVPPGAGALLGKRVALGRDAAGRLTVRPDGLGRSV